VAFTGAAAGAVTPTPARDTCLSRRAPCSWSYATGTTVALRATGFGWRSFFDGDFPDSDWTTSILPFGNGGTATGIQQPTGGNPGAARRMTLSILAAPGPDLTSAVAAFSWKRW